MTAYSQKLVDYIEENRMLFTADILAKRITEKFGRNLTTKSLLKYYYRHDLEHKTLNRKYNCTNSKPIGSESNPDKNGLVRVKISRCRWRWKQDLIYEQHYGEIPKGYKVIFLNGDKTDYRIENLCILKEHDMLTLYGNSLNSKDSEVTKTGILIAQLMNKINEEKLRLKDDNK